MADSLYIGLMSGTSLDGIDCALLDLTTNQLVSAFCRPIPEHLTRQLKQLCEKPSADIESMAVADRLLAEEYANAVLDMLAQEKLSAREVRAIGCHGQTIRHRPPQTGRTDPGFTIQIGDGATLAHRTGITVVADFRRRDIAAGGQGAPLAPAFHDAAFRDPHQDRVVINIGGIANISVLPRGAMTTGYDTGPGNTLIDAWIQHCRGLAFDSYGGWARAGHVNSNLLLRMLRHPYFLRPPPKSTGREEFNLEWVKNVIAASGETISDVDVQATLLELTATSISVAVRKHFSADAGVFVCGGGVHNQLLMERLAGQLFHHQVDTTEVLGISPDWVEAAAFAWLAAQCIAGKPANLPEVTGATEKIILGAIHPQPRLGSGSN